MSLFFAPLSRCPMRDLHVFIFQQGLLQWYFKDISRLDSFRLEFMRDGVSLSWEHMVVWIVLSLRPKIWVRLDLISNHYIFVLEFDKLMKRLFVISLLRRITRQLLWKHRLVVHVNWFVELILLLVLWIPLASVWSHTFVSELINLSLVFDAPLA